jgi:hypothetical protein
MFFNLIKCIGNNGNNRNNNRNISDNNNNNRINSENNNRNKEYIIVNKEFDNNECIICLEDMKVGDKIRILECGHIYHYDCINAWIRKKGSINCPICSK